VPWERLFVNEPSKRELNRGPGDALAKGFDLAGTVIVLFLIGWGLDAWLGTTPLFMVGLVVIAMVAKLVVFWYLYDAEMKRHEARLPKVPPA
jgi:F0F1-type ATP synthase assembly protein I